MKTWKTIMKNRRNWLGEFRRLIVEKSATTLKEAKMIFTLNSMNNAFDMGQTPEEAVEDELMEWAANAD